MISRRLLVCGLATSAWLPAQQSAADAFSSAVGVKPTTPQPAIQPAGSGLPAGTSLVVKIIDDIDSERDPAGRTFPAMVDDPVVVNGKILLERGADVTVKLVEDPKAPRVKGTPVLTLEMAEIVVNGRACPALSSAVALTTTPRVVPKPQQAAAAKPGGASAFGALLGALSGTEQAAEYMGTVTGSTSAGVAKTWVTGVRVRLNEETRLTFKLANPVRF